MGVRGKQAWWGRWLTFAGLISFTFSSAILPQGFMHASLGSGAPFALCPSDTASNTWLQLIAPKEKSQSLMPVMAHDRHVPDSEGHHTSHTGSAPDSNALSCEISSTFKHFILALSVVSTLPTRIPRIEGVDLQTILTSARWIGPLARSPPLTHLSRLQTSQRFPLIG